MKQLKLLPILVIICLGVLVPSFKSASLSIYEQKKYKQLIDGQGLYGADDDVVILTVHNFKEKVYGQKHAWLIEFYNSWCGFCQRFAPSWKALASDVRGWHNVVRIGAIDCSDEDNSPFCRDFEIMAYPTLRYFYEDYEEGPKKLGAEVQKGEDVEGHKRYLIRHIVQEQMDGRGEMYPNLQPYKHQNLNHLFDDVPINTKYVFLIFENGTMLGPQVALDLMAIPHIAVKFTNENYTQLAHSLNIQRFPHMIVLSDNNKSQQFAVGLNSRESLKMAIIKFLRQNEIVIPDHVSESPGNIYTGKWIDADIPDIDVILKARERKAQLEKARAMGDVVFQMDLEMAVRSALGNEVAKVKTISGEKREALIKFLQVLVKYLPLSPQGNKFLYDLKNRVETIPVVTGNDIENLVHEAEKNGQVFSTPAQWLGCEGSIPGHRGHPCGLWKLFHFLTVNAAESRNPSPQEVLNAMHGYIKNFFGCADCSQHFQDMAQRRQIDQVRSANDAIIWLWSAHNEVNQRLKGDITEDPQFPKVQFPTTQKCVECKNLNNYWNNDEVLKYLKNMYRASNIKLLGVDTKVLHQSSLTFQNAANSSISLMQGLDATRLPKKDVRSRPIGQSMI